MPVTYQLPLSRGNTFSAIYSNRRLPDSTLCREELTRPLSKAERRSPARRGAARNPSSPSSGHHFFFSCLYNAHYLGSVGTTMPCIAERSNPKNPIICLTQKIPQPFITTNQVERCLPN